MRVGLGRRRSGLLRKSIFRVFCRPTPLGISASNSNVNVGDSFFQSKSSAAKAFKRKGTEIKKTDASAPSLGYGVYRGDMGEGMQLISPLRGP